MVGKQGGLSIRLAVVVICRWGCRACPQEAEGAGNVLSQLSVGECAATGWQAWLVDWADAAGSTVSTRQAGIP